MLLKHFWKYFENKVFLKVFESFQTDCWCAWLAGSCQLRGRSLLLNAAPLGTSWHLQAHQHCHLMEAPMTPSTGQSIKSTHIATQSSSTLPSHGRSHPRLQHHAPDGSFKIRDGKPPFLKHPRAWYTSHFGTPVHPAWYLVQHLVPMSTCQITISKYRPPSKQPASKS